MDEENNNDNDNKQAEEDTTDYKAKFEELQTELKEKEEELAKVTSKEVNFSNLKNQTEEEKKRHDDEKDSLNGQIEELKKQNEDMMRSQMDDWYFSSLASVTNGDEEKAEKIKAEYDILNLPTSTRSEVQARMDKAVKLAGITMAGSINTISHGSGRQPAPADQRFSDTERGKTLMGMMAPDLKDINKDKEE